MPPALEPCKLPADPLVLVSDTSTEAERLIACLRARGFRVRDVPMLLLAGRVESQQPGLVVCDGEAPKLVETLKRIRTGEEGRKVDCHPERSEGSTRNFVCQYVHMHTGSFTSFRMTDGVVLKTRERASMGAHSRLTHAKNACGGGGS